MWSVYLLVSGSRTYVGATINLRRRLRQHNGEIRGGAKYTSGRRWKRVCFVGHFSDQKSALQFEWRWKHLSRKERARDPLKKRFMALKKLLLTTNASHDARTENIILYVEDFNVEVWKMFETAVATRFVLANSYLLVFALLIVFFPLLPAHERKSDNRSESMSEGKQRG